MKKIISAVIATTAALTIGAPKTPAAAPDISGLYPKSAVVVALDYEADTVTLEDANGIPWTFDGCEDWDLGDVANLLMWDNGTEIIFDDVILRAVYSGYTA